MYVSPLFYIYLQLGKEYLFFRPSTSAQQMANALLLSSTNDFSVGQFCGVDWKTRAVGMINQLRAELFNDFTAAAGSTEQLAIIQGKKLAECFWKVTFKIKKIAFP